MLPYFRRAEDNEALREAVRFGYLRGIPECFFGHVFFLEAWGAQATKPHFFKNIVVFGLAAEGGKANKPLFY